jgi:hypothetical protein
MSIGKILDRGFSLLARRFVLFFAIMFLVQVPVLLMQLLLPDFMLRGGSLILVIPTVILQTIGTGALIRVIMQVHLGRPVGFAEAFQFALRRFGSLLGTSLLSGFIILLGLIACIVPGIYFAIAYSLVSQVVIVEDRAGVDALHRSKGLVSSDSGRVFVLLFLVVLLGGLLLGGIGFVLRAVLPFEVVSTSGFAALHVINDANYAIHVMVITLVQTILQVYIAICTTLLYFDLRNRQEAFNLELEADKITAWTERFHSRPQTARTDIQPPDEGIQPPGPAVPSETGVRLASEEVPPSSTEQRP